MMCMIIWKSISAFFKGILYRSAYVFSVAFLVWMKRNENLFYAQRCMSDAILLINGGTCA
jgi:hypothetical protein